MTFLKGLKRFCFEQVFRAETRSKSVQENLLIKSFHSKRSEVQGLLRLFVVQERGDLTSRESVFQFFNFNR